jgi:hypothetical protein
MTSDPRLVQQYIITLLLQLNAESSEARRPPGNQDADEGLGQRMELRSTLLETMYDELSIGDLQDVQQMAFALHLLTVSCHRFSLARLLIYLAMSLMS